MLAAGAAFTRPAALGNQLHRRTAHPCVTVQPGPWKRSPQDIGVTSRYSCMDSSGTSAAASAATRARSDRRRDRAAAARKRRPVAGRQRKPATPRNRTAAYARRSPPHRPPPWRSRRRHVRSASRAISISSKSTQMCSSVVPVQRCAVQRQGMIGVATQPGG